MSGNCKITDRCTIFLAPGQVESSDEELIEAARSIDEEEAAMIAAEEEENEKIPPAPRGKKKVMSICLTEHT